jgi:hypothetical protein
MRIAYYTLDVVNKFLVRSWAKSMGARIACPFGQPMFQECAMPTALILDVDFLPAELRTLWLGRVLSSASAGPALIHGHNITDTEAEALQRRGVQVRRGRLRKSDLIGWLACTPRLIRPCLTSGA